MNYAAGVGPMTAGRAARTVSRNAIVTTRVTAEGVGGADRDYRGFVSGCMILSVDLLAVRVLAVITGGCDDDDSRINQRPGCAADRIVLVRTDRGRAEAHVHYANVVLVF